MFHLCVVYLMYVFFVLFLLPTLTLGEEQALLFFWQDFFVSFIPILLLVVSFCWKLLRAWTYSVLVFVA